MSVDLHSYLFINLDYHLVISDDLPVPTTLPKSPPPPACSMAIKPDLLVPTAAVEPGDSTEATQTTEVCLSYGIKGLCRHSIPVSYIAL